MIPMAVSSRPAVLLRHTEVQDGDWNVIEDWEAAEDVLASITDLGTTRQATETGDVITASVAIRFNLAPSIPCEIQDRIRADGVTYRLLSVRRFGDLVSATGAAV